MRLAILSSGTGWHVRDLERAALALGHTTTAVDFRRVSAGVGVGPDSLAAFDAVLVRTMPPGSLEQVVFRMDVLHRLQAGGIVVLNPPAAVEASVDKYLTTARLAAADLPVPRTIVCQDADAALEAFEFLGRDVVVKPIFGSEGRGMIRVSDPELAWRTFRTLERQQAILYVQEFVRHPGWDLRAFVLDGRILAAMRRRANGDWRTNVAQGGRGEPVALTGEQTELALAAARALHVPMAGIDLLPGPDGRCLVLEVNAVPGWRALAPVAGIDIAAALVAYAAAAVSSERLIAPAQLDTHAKKD
jgi:RimK family alpha-L-glutamate ligase